MENNITKPENKWILPSKSDEDLKQIAKDLYNGLIFSNRHLSSHDRVESHFMVLMFMLQFKEIITNYILYWKIKGIEKDREKNKESFQKMVDIIGKDVKRDSLIDQILSK